MNVIMLPLRHFYFRLDVQPHPRAQSRLTRGRVDCGQPVFSNALSSTDHLKRLSHNGQMGCRLAATRTAQFAHTGHLHGNNRWSAAFLGR
mmetsp:Transcript_23063/g.52959  ORF Transcript_23063/g.52959 Transcript_23063/m.52959 type:complete len:90 (-) Transcript_23063:1277-1546(-)